MLLDSQNRFIPLQSDGAVSGSKVQGSRSRRARVHSGDSTQEESVHQTEAADGELEEQPEEQEAEPEPEQMELEDVEEVEEVGEDESKEEEERKDEKEP